MPWAAAGAVAGGVLSYAGSSQAASAQEAAARNAGNLNWDMYQQQRADTAPWREAGRTALNQMADRSSYFNSPFTAADFEAYKAPNYEFQLGQGMKSLANRQSAGGGRLSGNSLQAINDYAQNYASGAYQNAFSNAQTDKSNIYNRLANMAGLGQGANQITAQAGTAYGGNIGNAMIGAGNAQAAGYVGGANALSGMANTIGGLAAWYRNPQQIQGGNGMQGWGTDTGPYAGGGGWEG